MNKIVRLGEVAVDSGQLMIADPSYMAGWEADQPVPGQQGSGFTRTGKLAYSDACAVTCPDGLASPGFTGTRYGGNFGARSYGQALAFRSGYGDGVYPVYARVNEDGRVVSVTVYMDGQRR